MPKLVVGMWYVVNSRWVKIVNKLRRISGISCDNSSIVILHKQYKYVIRMVQIILTKQSLPQPSTVENTPKTIKFNLLNKSFTHFPQDLLITLKNEI